MTRLTENTIKELTIKLLAHNGYEYIYAPCIAGELLLWMLIMK